MKGVEIMNYKQIAKRGYLFLRQVTENTFVIMKGIEILAHVNFQTMIYNSYHFRIKSEKYKFSDEDILWAENSLIKYCM